MEPQKGRGVEGGREGERGGNSSETDGQPKDGPITPK